jgi:hypothetical protein
MGSDSDTFEKARVELRPDPIPGSRGQKRNVPVDASKESAEKKELGGLGQRQ